MFNFLGRLAARHPWPICAAWAALGLAVALLAPSWDNRAQDDDIRFLPARCDSVRGYHLLEQAFPQDVFASRILFALERPGSKLSEADLALADALTADLEQLRRDEPSLQIGRICSHHDPFIGKRLVSNDGECTLVQVSLGTPYLALQTRATVDAADLCVRRRLAGLANPPVLHTTGPAGIGRDLTSAGANSLESTTLATIVLVVVILLLVHRAPLMALVPLVTIACSVWVALKLLALCTLVPGFVLVNISQIFAVVMLYGAGTDYCLFLISRYREELSAGHEPREALARSVASVGGALAASAGTVVCGLGLMGLAEFAKVRCGGPAIAVSLLVALAASLTLAPALLNLLGRAAFWPCRMPSAVGEQGTGSAERRKVRRPRNPLLPFFTRNPLPEPRSSIWWTISGHVIARPLLIWSVAVLLLLPLALVGFGVRANYRATGELSPTCSSVQGLAAIQRHFTAGEIGPITVLLESTSDWESPAGHALIAHLSQGFGHLDNVAEVRSLTQPLGSPVLMPQPPTSPNLQGTLFKAVWRNVFQGLTDQIARTAGEFYLARIPGDSPGKPTRHITRLDVVLRTDPFDPRSVATLELIQLWLREKLPEWKAPPDHDASSRPGALEQAGKLEPVKAECYGVTVNSRDLATVTEGDRLRINVLVLAGIFLILLVVVRRPWLAAYLLVTVLFSYYATLGATTLVAHWFGGRPLGEVDWRVPFFLFTILVAVGEDYNILLITRALQECKRHGPVKGMGRALAFTGGTITSCGLIMAGTFATLMLGGLKTLVQIGFALAFGVLLDTFVVRPFLVPALTLWVWQRQTARPAPAPTRRLRIIPDRKLRQAG
jgi:RND superfamily putative drug exporter